MLESIVPHLLLMPGPACEAIRMLEQNDITMEQFDAVFEALRQ